MKTTLIRLIMVTMISIATFSFAGIKAEAKFVLNEIENYDEVANEYVKDLRNQLDEQFSIEKVRALNDIGIEIKGVDYRCERNYEYPNSYTFKTTILVNGHIYRNVQVINVKDNTTVFYHDYVDGKEIKHNDEQFKECYSWFHNEVIDI